MIILCEKCGVEFPAYDPKGRALSKCPKCAAPVSVPMPDVKAGMTLGDFQLKRRIGAGGMGEVWLALQKGVEREVAVKLLTPALTKDPAFVSRFTREVKMNGRLDHSSIITVFYAGVEHGLHYMAMAYVSGNDLDETLKMRGSLPEKEALRLAKGVAEALRYAWESHRIIHRDIKPSNIMIDAAGNPKLMDMGMSKRADENVELTMAGVIVGTPCYMSPEQAKGKRDLDFRSDIYSLGATLYRTLVGDVPFEGGSAMEIATKHVMEPLVPPRVRNSAISPQASKLIEIMMAKSEDDRQCSWDEVVSDIDQVLRGGWPGKKTDSRPAGTLMAFVVYVLCVIVGVILFALLMSQEDLVAGGGGGGGAAAGAANGQPSGVEGASGRKSQSSSSAVAKGTENDGKLAEATEGERRPEEAEKVEVEPASGEGSAESEPDTEEGADPDATETGSVQATAGEAGEPGETKASESSVLPEKPLHEITDIEKKVWAAATRRVKGLCRFKKETSFPEIGAGGTGIEKISENKYRVIGYYISPEKELGGPKVKTRFTCEVRLLEKGDVFASYPEFH